MREMVAGMNLRIEMGMRVAKMAMYVEMVAACNQVQTSAQT
jgi:hypothetical protein